MTIAPALADLTLIIPLYRSLPLLDIVIETVDSHLAAGASILISDQHHLDAAAEILQDRYAPDDRVTVLCTSEGGDWVENVNLMLSLVGTAFFRVHPHDDSVDAASSAVLCERLRNTPSAILCHGYVRAEDADGRRLPERDEPKFPLFTEGVTESPSLEFTLALFWAGAFSGSFKSVIRSSVVRDHSLYIRKTPTLEHSERAWLTALSLVGGFLFDENASMRKRYWTGSVSDGWARGGQSLIDAADVICSYIVDLVPDAAFAESMQFNMYLNAMRRSAWMDGLLKTRPPMSFLMATEDRPAPR